MGPYLYACVCMWAWEGLLEHCTPRLFFSVRAPQHTSSANLVLPRAGPGAGQQNIVLLERLHAIIQEQEVRASGPGAQPSPGPYTSDNDDEDLLVRAA